MTAPRCPICQGETFEIRAKLVCRGCGAILETCCEGGPMGMGNCASPAAAQPAPSEQSDESQGG